MWAIEEERKGSLEKKNELRGSGTVDGVGNEITIPPHRKDFDSMMQELKEYPEKFLEEMSDYVIDTEAVIPGPCTTVFVKSSESGTILVDTSELYDGTGGGYCPFVLYLYSLIGEVCLAFRNIAHQSGIEFKNVPVKSKMYLTEGMKDIALVDITLLCPEGKLGEYSDILERSLIYCPLIKILPQGSIKIRVQVEGS